MPISAPVNLVDLLVVLDVLIASTTRQTAETANTAVNAHKRCLAGPSPLRSRATMTTAAHSETAPQAQGADEGPLAGVRVLDLGTV